MSYSGQGQTPLGNALGAVAGYLGGVQQKKTLDYQKQQDAIANQQAAAALALQQQQAKFDQSLYAPGQYKPKTTVGKFQQGPKKGQPKTMYGAPQYVPGTGGYYTQQLQQQQLAEKAREQEQAAMTAAYAALANQRNVETSLAPGRAKAYEFGQTRPRAAGRGTMGGPGGLPRGMKPEQAFAMLSPQAQALLTQWRQSGMDPQQQMYFLSNMPNVSAQDKQLAAIAVGAPGEPKRAAAAKAPTEKSMETIPPGVTLDYSQTVVQNGVVYVKGSDGNGYAWRKATAAEAAANP